MKRPPSPLSRARARPKALALAFALAPACASPSARTEAQLTALEKRYAEDAARIDGVAIDLDRLTITQRQVLATYAAAKGSWTAASTLQREAASQSDAARRAFDQAAADYAEAERNFRLAAVAMATIAAGSILCEGTVTTAKYRTQLKREGIDLHGKDIDHLFPRSLGGIDHPLNYQVLDSSLNRSLSNKLMAKFMQAPLGVITGLAVSALGILGGCGR